MRILTDNESLGCSQNPSNTPHTDDSPYFLIIKLPGTRRSVYCFHMTSCLAYIVVKLATISHEHRRTRNFFPGGGGKPFAQKNLSSCPNFYESVEKK